MPDGCRGEWVSIAAQNFEGTHHACSGFREDTEKTNRTVLVGVSDETIRRVALQQVFDSRVEAESAFETWHNRLLKQCARTGGASRRQLSFTCDDHVVSLQYRPRERGGQLQIIYGLESLDIPR